MQTSGSAKGGQPTIEVTAARIIDFVGARPSEVSPPATTPDRIAYMADLIDELCTMARGNPTLAGLLALAHREALREINQK